MRMIIDCYCCCSVAKSCLTLRPPWMQHARLLCPPLSPRVCSNACPLSRWCKWSHPLPPLSPFAFNSQVLSKASEGLSRAKKVTHFCSDGWISWKPPPPSLRAAEGQPSLAGVVLLEVPASCSGWGDGDWQHCLWSHQLVPRPLRRAGFIWVGWGWLAPGSAEEESCSQGRAGRPVVAKPLPFRDDVCSQRCLQRQKFLFSLNKSSSSLNSTTVMGVEISEMAERPTEHTS